MRYNRSVIGTILGGLIVGWFFSLSGGNEDIIPHQKRKYSQAQVKTTLKKLIGAESHEKEDKEDLNDGDCFYHNQRPFFVSMAVLYLEVERSGLKISTL